MAQKRVAERKAYLAEQTPPTPRAIAGLDPLVARSIAVDMDLYDLTGVTPEMIVAHYVNEEGMTRANAERWLGDLMRHAHGN